MSSATTPSGDEEGSWFRAPRPRAAGRRERVRVIGDLLSAVLEEQAKGSAARISNVATRANIAYDRLEPYLAELRALGLVTPGKAVPELTEKGRELLRHYRSWHALLRTYGLD